MLTAVPFAVLGALVAIWLRGLDDDVYFQIGLVTLIGLAAKNAILIIEFAAQRHRQGLSVYDAAIAAARPVVMTTLHRSRTSPTPSLPQTSTSRR